jgi:hypothetical protein
MAKLVEFVRALTDGAIDAASDYGKFAAKKNLEKIIDQGRKNFRLSIILNAVMLVIATGVAFFIADLRSAGIFIVALINYVICGRAIINIIRFFRTVIIPYREIIKKAIPGFFVAFRRSRSFETAVKMIIRVTFNYYYSDKLSDKVQTVHRLASLFGFAKSKSEIENKIADDFYPLIRYFVIKILIYNILFFTVCYGFFVFILKTLIFNVFLDIPLWKLWVYPFLLLNGG